MSSTSIIQWRVRMRKLYDLGGEARLTAEGIDLAESGGPFADGGSFLQIQPLHGHSHRGRHDHQD